MIDELARLRTPDDAPPSWGMTVAVTTPTPAATLAAARAAMIHALTGQPLGLNLPPAREDTLSSDLRDWMWWSAAVVGPDQLDLVIALEGFPVSGFDALRDLLTACGATGVAQTRR